MIDFPSEIDFSKSLMCFLFYKQDEGVYEATALGEYKGDSVQISSRDVTQEGAKEKLDIAVLDYFKRKRVN